jgi:hypothetical protein
MCLAVVCCPCAPTVCLLFLRLSLSCLCSLRPSKQCVCHSHSLTLSLSLSLSCLCSLRPSKQRVCRSHSLTLSLSFSLSCLCSLRPPSSAYVTVVEPFCVMVSSRSRHSAAGAAWCYFRKPSPSCKLQGPSQVLLTLTKCCQVLSLKHPTQGQ